MQAILLAFLFLFSTIAVPIILFYGVYEGTGRTYLRALKKSQFSSILAGMPKTYIATPIRKKNITPVGASSFKLELTDMPTVESNSVDLKALPDFQSLTGTLRRKAAHLVQAMQKVEQHNLSVEDTHNLGVILEQFVVSIRLFEGLPETRKDRALKNQLWNQWNTLELAAEDIHVRKVEGSVKQLSIGSLFVESKFGTRLQLTKKQGK